MGGFHEDSQRVTESWLPTQKICLGVPLSLASSLLSITGASQDQLPDEFFSQDLLLGNANEELLTEQVRDNDLDVRLEQTKEMIFFLVRILFFFIFFL